MRRAIFIGVLALAAGCATTAPPPPSPTPAPSATVVFEPVLTPTPTPIPAPTGPVSEAKLHEIGERPVRVLLERGRGPFALPQPGRAYRAETDGRETWLWGPLEITAGSAPTSWQVGAWSTVEAAEGIVAKLGSELGAGVSAWREPTGSGLYRVKCRWSRGDPPDAKARLAAAGFPEAFAAAGDTKVRITGSGGSVESGAPVVLTPSGAWPTAVDGRRYRGRFVIRPAGTGLLIVNELAMEQYLRGVVPVEMGPYVFPELEALKAQAVAARTYTVAHLGDHDEEGWDICDTPACQAYHGAAAEHSLTDRAVAETAGLVAIFDGAPIDAMYTSTCGGHTEDAAELFDGRGAPYLVGVTCAWERPLKLVGEGPPAPVGDLAAFRRFLAVRALGLRSDNVRPRDVLPAVAGLCGGAIKTLSSKPGLQEWAEALLAAAGLDSAGPLSHGSGAERLVGLADLFEIPLPPAVRNSWDRGWHLEAVSAVLEIQGLMVTESGEAVPHPGGVAIYPRRADASEPLTQPLPLLWRWDGGYGRTDHLDVLPGTLLERVRIGDRTLAVVVVRSSGGGEADRRSAWRSWRREKSWNELENALGEPRLRKIEIVRRGRSGRVVELAVIDTAGNRRTIDGFDVRRALDLPETLFEMHLRTDSKGKRSAIFLGRGWGHGVGLCQNGAYGLARSGMGFEAVLKHYYTGIDVVLWR